MGVSAKLFCVLALASLSQAKVVRYDLNIGFFPGSPDGVHKETILGINGQFPGPTLEANVGDTLEVLLTNSIQDGQNTSMHWHGIHMQGSIFEDGAAMFTQCPLPVGRSMFYRFNVTQAGTYWYHSHTNSQYTEGMFGQLLVHGTPEAHPNDGEFTLILSDWYHQDMHENERWHLSPPSFGVPPYPNSGLINGMGRYPCAFAKEENRTCDANLQLRPVIKVQQDKTYRVRIINAAAVSAFNFSIDQHSLRTIEADGLDVAQPIAADVVPIAAGQRYSFLVQCRAPGKYLIRSNLRTESLMLIEGENINKYPEALMPEATAVLECVNEDMSRAKNLAELTTEKWTHEDVVPPYMGGQRTYLDQMDLSPLVGGPAPDHFDQEFVLKAVFEEDHEDIRRGSFNHTPFVGPDDKPLLMKLLDGEGIPEAAIPLEIKSGEVIQVVVNNPFFGPHPFHLHGHHFWVVGTGKWFEGDYDPAKHNLTVNGVKRDTFLVEEQSWAVIRFVADNPGVWIFHCHIDWHMLSGMALTFVEGEDVLRRTTEIPDEALRVCRMHEHYEGPQNKISPPKQSSNNAHYHYRH